MRRFLELLFFVFPVIIMILVGVVLWFGLKPYRKTSISNSRPTKITSVAEQTSGQFAYQMFKFSDLSSLQLLYNKYKQDAKELAQQNRCLSAINGGFYDHEQQPLGLLTIDGQTIHELTNSQLLNGYVWRSKLGSFGITETLPDLDFIFVLQTGPLLYQNGQAITLKIANDKMARRSVIGTLNNNDIFFLIVYDPQSVYLGPKLANLAKVINRIVQSRQLFIIDAVNLDGGTASMYFDSKRYLNEYKSVSSLFCVRDL